MRSALEGVKLTNIGDILRPLLKGLEMFSERELERRARHRLEVLTHAVEVSGNVAATCRHFGIRGTSTIAGSAVMMSWVWRALKIGLNGHTTAPMQRRRS